MAAESKKDTVHELLEGGLKKLHGKKFAQARKVFEKILEGCAEDKEIAARVRVYRRICDRHLEAEKKEPAKSSDEFFNLGVFHHNDGHYEEALEHFKKALSLAKKSPDDHIYYAMAATEARQGHAPEALKNLKKAIESKAESRFFARSDPDFETLHKNEGFQDLIRSQK